MTDFKPTVSKRNMYYIPAHRFYELKYYCLQGSDDAEKSKGYRKLEMKHYCLQYPVWRDALSALNGLSKRPADLRVFVREHDISDPTAKVALAKDHYYSKMLPIEQVAYDTSNDLGSYILEAAINNRSFAYMQAHGIPCCESNWYKIYNEFIDNLSDELPKYDGTIVMDAAIEADEDIANYIFKAVTNNMSYSDLKGINLPYSTADYHDVYRRFFWLLSKAKEF